MWCGLSWLTSWFDLQIQLSVYLYSIWFCVTQRDQGVSSHFLAVLFWWPCRSFPTRQNLVARQHFFLSSCCFLSYKLKNIFLQRSWLPMQQLTSASTVYVKYDFIFSMSPGYFIFSWLTSAVYLIDMSIAKRSHNYSLSEREWMKFPSICRKGIVLAKMFVLRSMRF